MKDHNLLMYITFFISMCFFYWLLMFLLTLILERQRLRKPYAILMDGVGMAFFFKESSFKKLSDDTLYGTKYKGKNIAAFCDDGDNFSGYTSNKTEMELTKKVSQKSFQQNRIEYVFKMLCQPNNSADAVQAVLELVASHFSFERGYIFEISNDGKTTTNTFEWCANEVTSKIKNLQNIPIEKIEIAKSHFYKTGTFILKNLEDLQPTERAVLESQEIKSMFQFGIFDKNQLLGFIGFENCRSKSISSDADIDEMTTICNILAAFFVKQHLNEASENSLLLFQEMMNQLDSYIYVINMQTFEVLYMNAKTQRIIRNFDNHVQCYSFFRGNSCQCEDCPVKALSVDETQKAVREIYNSKLHIWTEATATPLRWQDGTVAALINCVDITKQKIQQMQHMNQLEKLTYVDELTGGRTYHKFKEDAQRILEEQQLLSHLLVKLDIDNFKLINQIYGYEKGDEVLCSVAKALEKTMKNENEIFARVGNDEFIILLLLRNMNEIEVGYETFLQNFFFLVGEDFTFKMNFPHGRYIVSPGDVKQEDIMDMLEKVNIAHKAAKLDKSLSFVYYDESMTKDALHQNEIENKMDCALQNEEFVVYLQPKYYLDGEGMGGAEALVRWKNESADLFLPNSFIPIFEKNGFITKLDFYMLKKVCAIIKGWIDNGKEPVVISVNFSRLHLNNPNFVKDLCELVDSFGIERRYIEIEITETAIYDNIEALEILLKELHEADFTMAMDDFGSGYSSLGMLQNLSVDVIKMDRSFFVNQKDAKRSKAVVGSVIHMAASLGIVIVAEGVEEQEHIDLLRELNCGMVQGYYYAKPMPVEKFSKIM